MKKEMSIEEFKAATSKAEHEMNLVRELHANGLIDVSDAYDAENMVCGRLYRLLTGDLGEKK